MIKLREIHIFLSEKVQEKKDFCFVIFLLFPPFKVPKYNV